MYYKRLFIVLSIVTGFSLTSCQQRTDENDTSNNSGTDSTENVIPPAQHPTVTKNIQRIQGTWELVSATENGKEVTNNSSANIPDKLIFSRQNKYKRFMKDQQIDSGTFTMNENHSRVFLQSRTGGGTSDWAVVINDQNNEMTMQHAGDSAVDKKMKMTYRKTALDAASMRE